MHGHPQTRAFQLLPQCRPKAGFPNVFMALMDDASKTRTIRVYKARVNTAPSAAAMSRAFAWAASSARDVA